MLNMLVSLFDFIYQTYGSQFAGLFAPSAGQHMRDEQRRRRSQYDRGTSLAERDEYEYDDDDLEQFPPYRGCKPAL